MGLRDKVSSGTLFQNQLDFFNPEDFNIPVYIIGVGATGSWDALLLAKIGFTNIIIYDPDIVEIRNTSSQLYGIDDAGKFKVDAVQDILVRIADTKVTIYKYEWEPRHKLSGIVIMGADSMRVRRQIYEETLWKPNINLVVDHRIGGQKAQLFAYSPTDSNATTDYETTLFSDENAAQLPCTARGVGDINLFVASMTVRNIRQFLVKGKQALIYEMHYDAETGTFVKRQPGGAYKVLE